MDLGRFWQLLLMVGLLLWLFLMLRCTISAFKEKGTDKNLLAIFVASMVGGCVLRSWLVLREISNRSDGILALVVVHLLVKASSKCSLLPPSHSSSTTWALSVVLLLLLWQLLQSSCWWYSRYIAPLCTSPALPLLHGNRLHVSLEVVPLVLLGREAYEHWSYQHLSDLGETSALASDVLRAVVLELIPVPAYSAS